MAGYDSFKYGGIVFPLPSQAGGTPLLEICDPGLGAILQFLRSVIDSYVGNAFVAAAAGAEGVTNVIGHLFNVDPLRIGKHTLYKFPILCAWRTDSQYSNRTTAWRQSTGHIRVAYVMPPFDADTLVNLNPVLTAIERVVDHCLFMAFDPAYQAGQMVFTENGIVNCKLLSAARGAYQLADAIDFDSVVLELEIEEREMPHVSGDPMTSSYLRVDNSEDPDDPVLQVEVQDPHTETQEP
jgi:hypothetical protein